MDEAARCNGDNVVGCPKDRITGHAKDRFARVLATVLRLSSLPVRRAAVLLVAFALTTPLGAVVSYLLMANLGEQTIQIATALAAGTFLYVAIMDLLPKAFHVREQRAQAVLSLLAGLAVMLAILFVGA